MQHSESSYAAFDLADQSQQAATRRGPFVDSGPDQRRAPRKSFFASVTVGSEHNFYNGFSENISEGGLFVATDQLQELGSELEVTFELPNWEGPIRCVAEVAWVRDPQPNAPDVPPGMGVKFKGLPADVVDAIHLFVTQRDPIFFLDD